MTMILKMIRYFTAKF